ncbi:hypothetical protein BDW22DRAFT_958094 [Trametopsis cervina]|nr:hypothetical protein BDW22DRAFT_958094 [Trametopsis cervina]
MSLWRLAQKPRSLVWRLQTTRRVSTALPPNSVHQDETAPNAPNRILTRLTDSVTPHLEAGKRELATETFNAQMEQTTLKSNNRTRFAAYERMIDLLLKYGDANEAKGVYTRMTTEGYLPSLKLKAAMMVLRRLPGDQIKYPRFLVPAIEKAVRLEEFDEAHFRYLLKTIYINLPCDSEVLETVIETFLASRTPGYKLQEPTRSLLAYLHHRLGSLELAEKWNPTPTVRVPERVSLLGMLNSDQSTAPIVRAAILRLDSAGLPHDRELYSSLIKHFVKEKHYDRAFSVYYLMCRGGPSLSPDGAAYKNLFDAWLGMLQPRSFRTRQSKQTREAPRPRQLFNEMLHQHRATPIMSDAVLLAALRAFMKFHDYGAAIFTLRMFRQLEPDVPLDAYRMVVGHLAGRVRAEMRFPRSPGVYAWADRFLGQSYEPSVAADSGIIIEGVLRLGTRQTLDPEPIPLPDVSPVQNILTMKANDGGPEKMLKYDDTKYSIPSTLVVLDMVPVDKQRWSTIPLERMLRRAIVCRYTQLFSPPHTVVAGAVSDARADMTRGL